MKLSIFFLDALKFSFMPPRKSIRRQNVDAQLLGQ